MVGQPAGHALDAHVPQPRVVQKSARHLAAGQAGRVRHLSIAFKAAVHQHLRKQRQRQRTENQQIQRSFVHKHTSRFRDYLL